MLDVDHLGLDIMDRKLLLQLLKKFDCGPVGLDNLAATIGESGDTIEDVIGAIFNAKWFTSTYSTW